MDTIAVIVGVVIILMLWLISKQLTAIHLMLHDRLPPDPDDQVPDDDDGH